MSSLSVLLLSIALVACGGSDPSSSATSQPSLSVETDTEIAAFLDGAVERERVGLAWARTNVDVTGDTLTTGWIPEARDTQAELDQMKADLLFASLGPMSEVVEARPEIDTVAVVVAGCDVGGSVRTVFLVPATALGGYNGGPEARNGVQSELEETELGPFDELPESLGPQGTETLPDFCQ